MIAIIGGGITGLSAAFDLHRRDAPFVVFEASDRVGGLIRTEHVDGFTIDAGADALLAQKPAALPFVEELGLTPRLISTSPPRTAYVLKRGRLHALPSPSVLGIPLTIRGALGYDLLPPLARLRLLAEPLVAVSTDRRLTPEGTPFGPEDESVACFFRRRFGRAAVDLIAEPLLGGIHAGNIEKLSIRALFPRLVEAEASGGVLRSMRANGHASNEGLFRSFQTGMTELVSAIERRLPAPNVVRGTVVREIVRDAGRWRLNTDAGTWRADAVILAVPAFAAGTLLGAVDGTASRLCAEVPYVSTVSIALAYPRDAVRHPLNGSGFVVARRHNTLRITACTWVSSKWAGRAPAGQALLRAFAGGAHDREAVNLSDGELIDLACRDIATVLGIQGEPRLARVYRWRNAGAQHNVGQMARVRAIEERLASCPGIYAAGSGFRSVGIPDCIADGRAAAARAARYDTMAR